MTVSKETEIDPMNAPTRTVFYDRNKSDKNNKTRKSSIEQNRKKSKSVKKQS